MSKLRLLVFLALIIGNFKIVFSIPSPYYIGRSCKDRCIFAFLCSSDFKQPVYSVVNGKCRVWLNSCLFNSENCSLRNQCQEEMIETTREVCVKYCTRICTKIYKPVCATFTTRNEDGESVTRKITFGNICMLESHVCQNGDPYFSQREGECEIIEEVVGVGEIQ